MNFQNIRTTEVWTHFMPDHASVFLSISRSSQENKSSKFHTYKFYETEILSIHLSLILAVKFVADCEFVTELHSSWRKRGARDFAKLNDESCNVTQCHLRVMEQTKIACVMGCMPSLQRSLLLGLAMNLKN